LSGGTSPASPLDPLRLGGTLAHRRPDVYVSPGYNAAIMTGCRQLITVHDLIHLRDASESSRAKAAYYRFVVAPAIKRTGSVLTVSHHTASALSEWADISLDHVKVVGNGTSIIRASEADLAEAEGHRRAGPYVLYVGNDKPHKNLGLLLKAMSYLDPQVSLVLVGPSAARVGQLAPALLGSERVRLLASVGENELRTLYVNASCLALPSTDEGFGLPALEAMALGVRTAYCCDAVGEVVADLGRRAPAEDPRAFAAAMSSCLDVDMAGRQELITRSLLFDWNTTTSRVLRAIEGIRR
jgi:glycosyltransferase involved in cell wall biosynthesis